MRWLDGIINSRHGQEFKQTLGDSEGQGGLGCFSPWNGKESDMIQQPNNNSYIYIFFFSPRFFSIIVY